MKRFPSRKKVETNPFARKTQRWFLDRIEKEITVKHPAGFESDFKIESKFHAYIPYKTRQLKEGYTFSDILSGFEN